MRHSISRILIALLLCTVALVLIGCGKQAVPSRFYLTASQGPGGDGRLANLTWWTFPASDVKGYRIFRSATDQFAQAEQLDELAAASDLPPDWKLAEDPWVPTSGLTCGLDSTNGLLRLIPEGTIPVQSATTRSFLLSGDQPCRFVDGRAIREPSGTVRILPPESTEEPPGLRVTRIKLGDRILDLDHGLVEWSDTTVVPESTYFYWIQPVTATDVLPEGPVSFTSHDLRPDTLDRVTFAWDPGESRLYARWEHPDRDIVRWSLMSKVQDRVTALTDFPGRWHSGELEHRWPAGDTSAYLALIAWDAAGQSTGSGWRRATVIRDRPPSDIDSFTVRDQPNDKGDALLIEWWPPRIEWGYVYEPSRGELAVDLDVRAPLAAEYHQTAVTLDGGVTHFLFSRQGRVLLDGVSPGTHRLRLIARTGRKDLPEFGMTDTSIILGTETAELPLAAGTREIEIYRSETAAPESLAPYRIVSSSRTSLRDEECIEGADTWYRIRYWDTPYTYREFNPAGPVQASSQWFDQTKLLTFVAMIVVFALFAYTIFRAKRGKKFYVRPIPGLVEIDNAIGRATEMGKPILYIPGLSVIDDIATIASLTILDRVAFRVAEYQTRIMVPVSDPIVLTVAQEVVHGAYLRAARSDYFKADDVFFITSEQFSFTAAACGLMVREKPATNLFIGTFNAEALILAETGASTGAIQIAGTDMVTQLPFFIVACDYTIMGEELYAASAYLSSDPYQVGTLRSQDLAKVGEIALIVVGSILLSLGAAGLYRLFA